MPGKAFVGVWWLNLVRPGRRCLVGGREEKGGERAIEEEEE